MEHGGFGQYSLQKLGDSMQNMGRCCLEMFDDRSIGSEKGEDVFWESNEWTMGFIEWNGKTMSHEVIMFITRSMRNSALGLSTFAQFVLCEPLSQKILLGKSSSDLQSSIILMRNPVESTGRRSQDTKSKNLKTDNVETLVMAQEFRVYIANICYNKKYDGNLLLWPAGRVLQGEAGEGTSRLPL